MIDTWKYHRQNEDVTCPIEASEEAGVMNGLVKFPVEDPLSMRILGGIQPGIFVTGGIARNIGLQALSGCSEEELPVASDCDFVTLTKGGIYTKKNDQAIPAIYAIYGGNVERRFNKFLENHTCLTIDQALAGTITGEALPQLFLTDKAAQDYIDRRIKISDQWIDYDKKGNPELINAGAIFRGIALSEILRSQGFQLDEVPDVIKYSLQRQWSEAKTQSKLSGLINKSRTHGILEETLATLSSYGLTVPSRLLK